jgi:hypothetical protein
MTMTKQDLNRVKERAFALLDSYGSPDLLRLGGALMLAALVLANRPGYAPPVEEKQ